MALEPDYSDVPYYSDTILGPEYKDSEKNIFSEAEEELKKKQFKEVTYEPLQPHERKVGVNIIENNPLKDILDKNLAETKAIVEESIKEKAPLDTQVGGNHYKRFKIQPIEFCQKNKLPYCESNVIKYVCRHSFKNGREDLEKAKHCIDLLIQMEYGDEDKGLQAN
jgi:hypothetical protein